MCRRVHATVQSNRACKHVWIYFGPGRGYLSKGAVRNIEGMIGKDRGTSKSDHEMYS